MLCRQDPKCKTAARVPVFGLETSSRTYETGGGGGGFAVRRLNLKGFRVENSPCATSKYFFSIIFYHDIVCHDGEKDEKKKIRAPHVCEIKKTRLQNDDIIFIIF